MSYIATTLITASNANAVLADRITEAVVTMEAGLDNGIIYNADFKRTKETLNRTIERAWEATVTNEWHKVSHVCRDIDADTANATSDVTYPYPQLHNVNAVSKRLVKNADAVEATMGSEMVTTIEGYLEFFGEIADKMKELKALIVMGRKPSTDSNTPVRTLENTGTCSVCGRNVKLDSYGTIVSHGYKVSWGMGRSSSCAGTGWKPFEKSVAGARNYLEIMANYVEQTKAELEQATNDERVSYPTRKGAVDRDSAQFETAREVFIANVESNLRYVAKDIEMFEAKVANWKESKLPMSK